MHQAFWHHRERDSIAHARVGSPANVQPLHYDLATSYTLKAAESGRVQLSSHGRMGEKVQ